MIYCFSGLRLDPSRRLLTDDATVPLALSGKAFDVLLYLVEHAGLVVTRDDLIRAIWPHTVVDDSNLNVAISNLRRALRGARPDERFIVTLAGRGYQFVAPVSRFDSLESLPPAAEDRSRPVIQDEFGAATSREQAMPPRGRGMALSTSRPDGGGAAPVEPRVGRKRWLRLLVAAGLAAIVLSLFAIRPGAPTDPADHRMTSGNLTLAVLPFRSLALSVRDESMELGMTEALINGLGDGGHLKVAPLSAVRRFVDPNQDAAAAGRLLNADSVLEGHLQRDGDRLRVSARLVRAADGQQLWSARYDEKMGDLFAVQDAIAGKVWAALTPELLGKQAPSLRRYTNNADAYQAYLHGRYHRLHFGPGDLQQARNAFARAIAIDPEFALAWVGLAETDSVLGVFGIEAPHAAFPRAQSAIRRALELAPDLGEAHAALGHIKVQYEHDWPGADAAYQRAIRLNPGYSPAWQWRGLFLAYSGRFDEAIEHMRKAQALDPGPRYSALIGMLLMYQRRHEDAIVQLEATSRMGPAAPLTQTLLGAAYLRAGRAEEAISILTKVGGSAPGSTGYLGQAYALAGRIPEAREELRRLRKLASERYVSAYDIASIHAALGEPEQAFEWLEEAFAERAQIVGFLPWDAVFDSLRGHPRYALLVRRLNLR